MKSRNLIFLCVIAYISAYIGRLSYTASMVGILDATGATKAEGGMVTTLFYLAYGIGQLVTALICHRLPPRQTVAAALYTSAAVNAAALAVRDLAWLRYLWLLNGAVQSLLWCTLIELLARRIPPEQRHRAIIAMSTTTPIGTTLIYSLSALTLAAGQVYAIFAVAAITVAAVATVWLIGTRPLAQGTDSPAAPAPERRTLRAALAGGASLMFICALLAIGNGYIRDTMVTWVPSLLYDSFGIPASLSVIVTLTLPLLSLCGAALAVALHRRIRSYFVIEGMLYCAAALSLGGVYLAYRTSSVPGILLGAGLGACLMAAINNILTSVIPLERKSGSGMFAGIMDAFCYAGSTLSGILPGLILEASGFSMLLMIMPIPAALLSVWGFCAALGENRKKV